MARYLLSFPHSLNELLSNLSQDLKSHDSSSRSPSKQGAVQAYKYFSTKMISMDDASDLEHIVTGNMLSVMKEERESSTGVEFREQFDIGEDKTMTWINIDAYLDGFVSLDEDMNPQFQWLMVDPTAIKNEDESSDGKLRKLPVHKYMLSVTYFADYKATWTDGEVGGGGP